MRNKICKELNNTDIGKLVNLCGWVDRRRDHGGVIFIDLRDHSGFLQITINPDDGAALFKQAETLRNETVIMVSGIINERPKDSINTNLSTGELELKVKDLQILNQIKKNLPFPVSIHDYENTKEELRLKYRYLDLRRGKLLENLKTRHKIIKVAREFLDNFGFTEVETPLLTKSTPEGARDFLVPARLSNGEFFALPQSPQLFKQLLMVGGLDKYYQIAKCFRDEDLRADRQPEFTQLDIEMSFISEEEIISFNESLIKKIWKEVLNIKFNNAFPRMSWQEAMDNYGTDRPDTRYQMLLKDLGGILGDIGFNIFTKAIKSGGYIKSITVKGGNSSISNVRIKPGGDIFQVAKDAGAGGLAFIRVKGDELETIGAIKNNLSEEHIADILKITEAKDGDLILLGAGDKLIVNQSLDRVRQYIAKDLNLIDKSKWNFLWVTDFPMFERNEEENRYEALHHPFCSPKNIKSKDSENLKKEIESSTANAYDLVLNGLELGGGSLRIHEANLQREVLKMVGLTDKEIDEKFGFLIEALEMGAPPHGGIAFGLDRITMLIIGTDSIRETIAFPKNQQAKCLLTNAPSNVSESQLKELDIEITIDE
ncbi:aspartate--tRNA ligase [Prochlorococcus marinus]|jgi:aspartyl-tRNA synthetase|uniref:Aspartate--tRNA(Asp/Asn) ligase n=1 Tax=Prochlorococcus marinus (strain MIT 9301) TaxID=167546 RepID=SYDND_PROM0|nr:aspartate--tRNA ligase [Prochlorococcus marinus]A3PFH7.1 RecName: Full=Aspartate--tRNA(Asp/Asn) ligase; AltName: Full=Aspartyl-tRNA synthetase; Short=AspRS; AltName: Full=Non-discriminating aspartyl-tRNA synthetase; Short=ND-AspRS [Prochlorococcus marinus str. MIT 9301]ABO18502.1 Aspartyl-tRNA synthetase [Prochlorococcus marinus str. MIT 9301]